MSSYACHDHELRLWVTSGSAVISSLVVGGKLWGLDLKVCHYGVSSVMFSPSPLVRRDSSVTRRDVITLVVCGVVPCRIFLYLGGCNDRLKCYYRLHVLSLPGDLLEWMS